MKSKIVSVGFLALSITSIYFIESAREINRNAGRSNSVGSRRARSSNATSNRYQSRTSTGGSVQPRTRSSVSSAPAVSQRSPLKGATQSGVNQSARSIGSREIFTTRSMQSGNRSNVPSAPTRSQKNPSGGARQPEAKPGKPGYQPGQPEPKPGKPGYQPGQPEPKPGKPGYQPGQPEPKPDKPGYQPGQPEPKPGKPGYQPGQPEPKPDKPGYEPGQPGYQPRHGGTDWAAHRYYRSNDRWDGPEVMYGAYGGGHRGVGFWVGNLWGPYIIGAALGSIPVIDYGIASPYEGCFVDIDGKVVCELDGNWYYAAST